MNILGNSISTLIIAASIAGLSAGLAQTAQPAPSGSSVVTFEFGGIETPTGSIKIALFDSEDAYNGGAPVAATQVDADGTSASVSIDGLPAGRYAAKIYHDVDGDGQMSVNPFGMPVEPFAFSNNAVGSMGPAIWADAAFDVASDGTRQTITIQ